MEEELSRMILETVLCVMWKGVSGSDDAAWLERGQVFSALTKLGTANELLLPVDHIKLRYSSPTVPFSDAFLFYWIITVTAVCVQSVGADARVCCER